jgi:hypothetical protein
MISRPHLNLITARYCVSLAVLVAVGFVWWQWWTSTLRMRALSNAVSNSRLNSETKSVLKVLAWSPPAWESGLIRRLAGPLTMMQVVWSGKIRNKMRGNSEVYIFDAFVRPVAPRRFHPCVS